MTLRKRTLQTALLATVLVACSNSKPVDIGDDRPAVPLGASLSDYAGEWEGYADAYRWNDGTDAIRIVLDASGNGVLEVGEAAPLSAPDPDQGYPGLGEWFTDRPISANRPVSGFSYPITGAMVESQRIRLATSSTELYREFCELQTPELITDGSATPEEPYACVSGTGYSTSDGVTCLINADPNLEVPCAKLACLRVCACTEESCTLRNDGSDIELDAELENDGEELEGTLVVAGERLTVRMMRL